MIKNCYIKCQHINIDSLNVLLFKPNYLALVLGVLITTPIYAQSLSYAEAEQQALKAHTALKPTKHYNKPLS